QLRLGLVARPDEPVAVVELLVARLVDDLVPHGGDEPELLHQRLWQPALHARYLLVQSPARGPERLFQERLQCLRPRDRQFGVAHDGAGHALGMSRGLEKTIFHGRTVQRTNTPAAWN